MKKVIHKRDHRKMVHIKKLLENMFRKPLQMLDYFKMFKFSSMVYTRGGKSFTSLSQNLDQKHLAAQTLENLTGQMSFQTPPQPCNQYLFLGVTNFQMSRKIYMNLIKKFDSIMSKGNTKSERLKEFNSS